MSDRMTPLSFDALMQRILSGDRLGVHRLYKSDEQSTLSIFGSSLETPIGPAAGPHTQLAENIVAAYLCGARFFELKTVQTLDGEDLPVSKPCILAQDECYNVEWSTELTVEQAFCEYVHAWWAINLLSKELELGGKGFVFNMSVGYDLEGIQSDKLNNFIDGLKDATHTPAFSECYEWATQNVMSFKNIDPKFIESVSPHICNSITLSTLHGCPPAEIERIAAYLIDEKHLNTFIKLNPTLLGYDTARKTLDRMGYSYVSFGDFHFKDDLQFDDAAPMLKRLMEKAKNAGLEFGVKLTNTCPVDITEKELPGEEMYMSGRALLPLSIALAVKLSEEFQGRLRISYSGGADFMVAPALLKAGIYPITFATTILKPGGYQRLYQIAELTTSEECPSDGVDLKALRLLWSEVLTQKRYKKPIKPLPSRKGAYKVPLMDCTAAPCSQNGCPIEQDIPEYIRFVGESKCLAALKVITKKNPLPNMTGTLCTHKCMDKCRRNFYEQSISIRDAKLVAVRKSMGELIRETNPPEMTGAKCAIIGAGPAGLSAAFFLARAGMNVTVFERRNTPGGIVRHVIPEFRIKESAIEDDISLVSRVGVKFEFGREVMGTERLSDFKYILLAAGAWSPMPMRIRDCKPIDALDFLERFKSRPQTLILGKNIVVVGGGNTAMDTARAAKRVNGVENVRIVYRRDLRNMPANEDEYEDIVKDGIEFLELLHPDRLNGSMLECKRMELGAPDASGRRSPVETDEIVSVPADTVITAIGQRVEEHILERFGVPSNRDGYINSQTREAKENLFVIGDAFAGPATIVLAIADATAATNEILKREGRSFDTSIPDRYSPENRDCAIEKKGILADSDLTHIENLRCLDCDTVCETCVDVCPNRANVTVMVKGVPQILHVDHLCNECGNCETFCPYDSAPYKEKLTLFSSKEEFETSTQSGFFVMDASSKQCLIRLWGEVYSGPLYAFAQSEDVAEFIRTVIESHSYLL